MEQEKIKETKKLTGFKIAEGKKVVIKRRAALKAIDMQEIFDGMVDNYFKENPMTGEELEIAAGNL